MKEKIQMPRKLSGLIIIVFVAVVIGAIVYFTRNYLNHRNELQSLLTKEIKGSIVALKDEKRGSYYLEILTTKETHKIHSLPIAWETKEYNIEVGDSVSKETNSNIMTFYKNKDGLFEKSCEYEIKM